jgi:peroxiredoxin
MLDDVTEVNVGSLAPDFSLESNGGAIVRLSEYRGLAHVILYFMREFTRDRSECPCHECRG